MSSKESKAPIIVKKVKKGHAGHHGGAWKVAYADFVTAMMAFFMVMWIVGMDQSVKAAIEGYFQNPVGFMEGQASTANLVELGSAPKPPSSLTPVALLSRRIEEQRYRDIGEKIKLELEGPEGLAEIAAQVEIVMTDEGLRIELVEGGDGEMFFETASARVKPAAERALDIIAGQLRTASAPIVLEGHTDATRFGSWNGYTNWELSADRANSARRVMEGAGLGAERVAQVRGYADQHLRVVDDPFAKSNRRISILLPFTTQPASVQEHQPVSLPDGAMPQVAEEPSA